MSISQRFNMLLPLSAMVLGITFSPASSRTWKPTPIQIAADYSVINHAKTNTETVNIKWWAAPTLTQGPITGFLDKYMVISVVHFHVNQGATLSFDDIKTLEANDGGGQPLRLVPRDELPPAFIGFLSTLEAGFRQSLGRLGDGTKFFVFDAGPVRACEKGGISVPFAGETYTWETPFPGCTKRDSLNESNGTAAAAPRSDQTAPSVPPSAGPKAVLYEEDRNHPTGFRYFGSAAWRSQRVAPASGQSADVAITADVEIPDQRIGVQLSLRHNVGAALPASHTIEIRFKLPADFAHGGISNVPGLLMKQGESTRGVPLAGRTAKVSADFFIVGLSSAEADMQRNVQLLKEYGWFDIPVVYSDGQRAIIAIEKGQPGERMLSAAFAAWSKAATSAAQTNH